MSRKHSKAQLFRSLTLVVILGGLAATAGSAQDQTGAPLPQYHIYAGNTHSHTSNTWSHGDQFIQAKTESSEKNMPGISVSPEGVQSPGKSRTLKPDWQKYQGPPSAHYALAKSKGYDFYITTEHSQEAAFQPVSPGNAARIDRQSTRLNSSHLGIS